MKPVFYCLIAGFCQVALSAPTFSLHNKSTKAIEAVITPKGKSDQKLSLEPGKFADIVELYDTSDKKIRNLNVTILDENKKVVYVASITPTEDKPQTIYINWNPGRTPPLYPQQGPFSGFTGKTDLGYSTKNNISSENIKSENDCVALKNEIGAYKNSYQKASVQLNPMKCTTTECKDMFSKLLRCFNAR